MEYRHAAKKAFVHADSSRRVASALLRKAAPTVGPYQVGDLISFQREQGSGNIKRDRWSPPARIIGFEHNDKVCWAICEGTPFCLATDKIMPANDAQTLAYRLLHEGEDRLAPEVQQSYIDNRTVVDDEVTDQWDAPLLMPEEARPIVHYKDPERERALREYRASRHVKEAVAAIDIVPYQQKRRAEEREQESPKRRSVIPDVHSDTQTATESRARQSVIPDARADSHTPTESRGRDENEEATESRGRTMSREPNVRSRSRTRDTRRGEPASSSSSAPDTGDVPGLVDWFEGKTRTMLYATRTESVSEDLLCFLQKRARVPMALNAAAKAG